MYLCCGLFNSADSFIDTHTQYIQCGYNLQGNIFMFEPATVRKHTIKCEKIKLTIQNTKCFFLRLIVKLCQFSLVTISYTLLGYSTLHTS